MGRAPEAIGPGARQKESHTSLVEAAPRACLDGLRECIRPGEGQGCRAGSRGEALGGAEERPSEAVAKNLAGVVHSLLVESHAKGGDAHAYFN